jgi:hypothetical protein
MRLSGAAIQHINGTPHRIMLSLPGLRFRLPLPLSQIVNAGCRFL